MPRRKAFLILPAKRPGPPIFPTRLTIDETIDWTAFSVWLSALLHARGDDVLRVKGVVRTPAGRLLLQSVRKIVQSPEILPEQATMRAARTTPSSSSAAAIAPRISGGRCAYFAGQRREALRGGRA